MGAIVSSQAFMPPIPTRPSSPMIYLHTAQQTYIPMIHIKYPGAKYCILFSHGNGEDLGMIEGTIIRLSEQLGADVVAYDYSGYGYSYAEPSTSSISSKLMPSEAYTTGDIRAVYDYITHKCQISPFNCILMGRSLGTGPTIELATRKPVGGVIFQSGFLSAIRVMYSTPFTLPFDIFANCDKIARISSPILFIHGTADTVINIEHSRKLCQIAKKAKKDCYYLWIAGADHNDIEQRFGEQYYMALRKFVEVIRPKYSH